MPLHLLWTHLNLTSSWKFIKITPGNPGNLLEIYFSDFVDTLSYAVKKDDLSIQKDLLTFERHDLKIVSIESDGIFLAVSLHAGSFRKPRKRRSAVKIKYGWMNRWSMFNWRQLIINQD